MSKAKASRGIKNPDVIGNESLPADHVIVHCSYTATPSMAELARVFTGDVTALFDGRRWYKHAITHIEGAPTPGNKVVWLMQPPKGLLSDPEAMIAWGYVHRTDFAPRGYRPMFGHDELLDLHRAHPELCKQFRIVPLGSFAIDDHDRRSIAVLDCEADEPVLDGGRFGDVWDSCDRFPFVRNEPSHSRDRP